MTEELREKLILSLAFKAFDDTPPTIKELADQILALFREAGWKSGEDFVRCPVCGEEYSADQLMECIEEGEPK